MSTRIRIQFKKSKTERHWVGYALKIAQHLLRQRLDLQLAHLGINAPQLAVLIAVARDPGVSNASLARSAFVTPQSMHGMLANLERMQLISRTPHEQHGRIVQTALTAKGLRVKEAGSVVANDVERLMLSELSPDEANCLAELLGRCSRALERHQEESSD
ncbi:MAG: MarR family transcriptional regulator [Pseudomonadota bacterium]|nr:MarR family transcriptional regulator [Pseudomonadota bacterium]